MEKQMYESWIQGHFLKAHTHFGAHLFERAGHSWCVFRVYAPSAKMVYIKGDFNNWYGNVPMQYTDGGVWEIELEYVTSGSEYKYCIETESGEWYEKTDPFAVYTQQHPSFNSIVHQSQYDWNDRYWLEQRQNWKMEINPLLIYEVHLGSWQKTIENTFLNYEEIAHRLINYVKECGFTHIELLPVTEHPFLGSWGYQLTGLFAATSRYGNPDQLKYLIDHAHQNGVGVIVDFVPVHFCKDMHGLQRFDGSNLYEYNDGRRENVGWGTINFDLGKGDVQSLLMSALDYWISEFHVDGVRFDAVSNLIYRNGMKHQGVNEEGISFVKHMNGMLELHYPDVLRIAEDSSDFQGVTRSTHDGGLGFHLKWDLGYANDHFQFMATPYYLRSTKADKITFARAYHESEHFLLPYSHDEVVHGKRSMLMKQQGSRSEQFAALSVEYAFWICHPGKKLLFMGQEFGQEREWNEAYSLDWHLFDDEAHRYFFDANKRLFHLYRQERALYASDYSLNRDFDWTVIDTMRSVYAMTRRFEEDQIIAIFNFDVVHHPWYELRATPGTYIDLFTNEQIQTNPDGVFHVGLDRLSYKILKFGGNI
ncbi:MAG: 1,4-alpha-glucan branching protein GlgB [Culicoidibacterales bacterium]